MQSRFKIFLESLIATFLILLIGFSMGFYVESYRSDQIVKGYKNHEVETFDLRLQNYFYQIMNQSSCDAAIKQNLIFADSVYLEGLKIEKYEEAGQLLDNIEREKKRYVLLKTELWLNSMILKQKCGAPFDTLVYVYANKADDPALLAQQKIISNILQDIKGDRGNRVILLPIAGDLGLGSVDLQMNIHNVKSLPSIIINEDIVLEGVRSKKEIESYLLK